MQGSDGDFYGTTQVGGNGGSGYGTVFRMTSDGTVTVLHTFPGGDDGAYPGGPLVQGLDGNFYGMTNGGGTGYGTVFRMTHGGAVTIIHAFAAGCREIRPCADLDEARKLADALPAGKALLAGERRGLPPEGFDLGNSPREFTPKSCKDRTVVLTTTNGTRAIARAAACPERAGCRSPRWGCAAGSRRPRNRSPPRGSRRRS